MSFIISTLRSETLATKLLDQKLKKKEKNSYFSSVTIKFTFYNRPLSSSSRISGVFVFHYDIILIQWHDKEKWPLNKYSACPYYKLPNISIFMIKKFKITFCNFTYIVKKYNKKSLSVVPFLGHVTVIPILVWFFLVRILVWFGYL